MKYEDKDVEKVAKAVCIARRIKNIIPEYLHQFTMDTVKPEQVDYDIAKAALNTSNAVKELKEAQEENKRLKKYVRDANKGAALNSKVAHSFLDQKDELEEENKRLTTLVGVISVDDAMEIKRLGDELDKMNKLATLSDYLRDVNKALQAQNAAYKEAHIFNTASPAGKLAIRLQDWVDKVKARQLKERP